MKDWVLVTDFDGIFTTPYFTYTVDGKTAKSFSPNDAHVAKFIIPHLKDFQILTGESSDIGLEITKKRLEHVGLLDRLNVCPGKDKVNWIKERYDITKVAYFGDDIFDLKIFRECGFSACPKSALSVLSKMADYMSRQNGGEDAFADMAITFASNKLGIDLTDI